MLARAFGDDPVFGWMLPDEGFVTASRFQSTAVHAHPREEPHWYLAIIGVDPARQGYGVGAALLRSRLRRCDQEGLPAYLESSNRENVPLYQHFGFHVTGTLGLPEGAPVVNTMWRPGAAGPGAPNRPAAAGGASDGNS